MNNRHFKLNARISEEFSPMEGALEQLVRERVRRGTVQVSLRVERPRRPEDYRLNLVALASYRDQLQGVAGRRRVPGPAVELAQLLVLPGVVEEVRSNGQSPAEDWPAVAGWSYEALEALEASRAQEGRAMADELTALGRSIGEHLGRVAERGAARRPVRTRGGSPSGSRRWWPSRG